eukprot:Amastigsp_a340456_90.p5 type:complete len:106 gc:universal Amastigsp_a340456_90:1280-1597(+)
MRMICQMRPRICVCLPSVRSSCPRLTTLHPIALAELMTRFWFSTILNALSARTLMAFGWMVSGTASLMSLQRRIPSLQAGNSAIDMMSMGRRSARSGSWPRAWLM